MITVDLQFSTGKSQHGGKFNVVLRQVVRQALGFFFVSEERAGVPGVCSGVRLAFSAGQQKQLGLPACASHRKALEDTVVRYPTFSLSFGSFCFHGLSFRRGWAQADSVPSRL